MKRIKISVAFGLLWLLFAAIYIWFFINDCCADSITQDSVYQLNLTRLNIGDMWQYILSDFSPPLYPYILKLYSMVIGDGLISLRTFSILLYVLLFWTALFPLRRLMGCKCAFLSAVIFLASSYNVYFGIEIRPTVMAYVMSTCTLIYAMLVYFDGRKTDVILLTVFALAAAYTHNVSLVFVFCMYAFLIVASIIEKEYIVLRRLLVSGVIVALLYLPWILVLISQMEHVRTDYWRADMSMIEALSIVFVGIINNKATGIVHVVFVCMIFISVIISVCCVIDREKITSATKVKEVVSQDSITENCPNTKKFLFLLACVVIAVVFYKLSFQLVLGPVFAERYFYIFSGGGIIAISALFTLCDKKKVYPLIIVAGLLVSFVFDTYLISKSVSANEKDQLVADIINADDDPVFVHFERPSMDIMTYICSDDVDHYATGLITESQWYLDKPHTIDVYTLSSYDDIWDRTDSFYICSRYDFGDYDSSNEFAEIYSQYFEDENINITLFGRYWLPYYGHTDILRVTHN